MEGLTDILVLQNRRAKHLFSIFIDKVEPSLEDPTIRGALEDLNYCVKHYKPFLDLTKPFEIVIRDSKGVFCSVPCEGFKK